MYLFNQPSQDDVDSESFIESPGAYKRFKSEPLPSIEDDLIKVCLTCGKFQDMESDFDFYRHAQNCL